MKKLLLILLLLPFVAAQPVDWFQAASVQTQLNISSDIDIIADGSDPFVESLKAEVIFLPRNSDFLAVRAFDSFPPATVISDRVIFEWKNPGMGKLSFKYSALLEVANNAPRVSAKIPFPLKTPKGYEEYVKPTTNIDSVHPKVIGQAYSIAQGEDDLFVVVSKIGFWVKNNIDYNLSTLTAEVSQPASWVLENRYGVCDEMTSLFIAMLRSLKIPSRFISGLAYTNSPLFPQGWGAHGWAEVYFPGVGWVPFDPTFGEFGWLDPGHIKLKESLDPQEPTTIYQWQARDVKVEVKDLNLAAVKLKSQGVVPLELKLKASVLRPRVGFGSYNAIMLEIENLADYYVSSEFSLTRVTDMQIIGGESQQIVLPPRGTGRVFWKVKLRDNLDPTFQYQLPIQIYTIRNDVVQASFSAGQWDIAFSESDIDSSIERMDISPDDPFDLACVLKEDMIWTDQGKIDCIVQNRVDSEIMTTVCFKECVQVVVPAKTSMPISFDVLAETPGKHEVEVTASFEDFTKKAVLTLVRFDRPRISVKDVSLPEIVAYGDKFTLSFRLTRESVSFPEDVLVEVKGGGAEASIEVGELQFDQDVNVNIRSEQLYSSSPSFSINVYYKDPFDKKYTARSRASISVTGMPWYKRFLGWFIELAY